MICPVCSSQIKEGERFCSNCGSALSSKFQGYRHAGFLYRFLAYIIDALLLLVPLTIIMLYWLYGNYGDQLLEPSVLYDVLTIEMPLFTVASMLIFFLYFSILEGRFQATLGKKLLGLRVVDAGLEPIGFQKALLRNALRLLWEVPFIGLGLLFMIIDVILILLRNQRIGDIAAGTYVLKR
jgi:uncharacterized RDD family membrane protein YckC